MQSIFVGGAPSASEKSAAEAPGALGMLRTVGGAIFNTGGAATGLIVSQGKVGIGTVSPSQSLDIVSGSGDAAIHFKAPGGTVFTNTYNSDGTWTVPLGVNSIYVDARGAQGAKGGDIGSGKGGQGGKGAMVTGNISVTPGQTIYILVGSQVNGGAGGVGGLAYAGPEAEPGSMPSGGAGGGASDVRRGGGALSDRVAVAGGGGGGGGASCAGGPMFYSYTNGGDGGMGGEIGSNGVVMIMPSGGGGAQSGGGSGGGNGLAGGSGFGGAGGAGTTDINSYCAGSGGGGGGAGYYGGGGGGGGVAALISGSGGGGGSSLVPAGGMVTNGFQSGNGQVIITYTSTLEDWAMGVDQSDSGKFKISRRSSSVGTNDVLTIDPATGQIAGSFTPSPTGLYGYCWSAYFSGSGCASFGLKQVSAFSPTYGTQQGGSCGDCACPIGYMLVHTGDFVSGGVTTYSYSCYKP